MLVFHPLNASVIGKHEAGKGRLRTMCVWVWELSLPVNSYATKHPAAMISGDDITRARVRRGEEALSTNSRTARNKPDERRIMHTYVRTFQGRSFHLGRQKLEERSARWRRRAIVVLSKYSRPIDRAFYGVPLKCHDSFVGRLKSVTISVMILRECPRPNYARDSWDWLCEKLSGKYEIYAVLNKWVYKIKLNKYILLGSLVKAFFDPQ